MIKNIIFDFDGVIADSEILVARAFSNYLKNLNITFSEQEFSNYAGNKTYQVIDELSEKFKIKDTKKFFDDIMYIAKDIYSTDLKPVNGAKIFLENNTKNFFIGSNSVKDKILLGLKKIQLEKFFSEDKIFAADLVKNPKPHPDIYLKAINTHDLNKDETIIIEDSEVGIRAGVAAGIKVIALTAGQHWYEDRSKKELIEAGALCSLESYDQLMDKIDSL